ncbi:FecR family protein [Tunicatimonas pelagia]|uniref:FecR family protein n=1 Tax=Tunicatimonas pelagia TaxID=931531 RepID=UPI002665C52A|nr:FecR family protein [Tunicatimonas pelagia]WKN44184.1 FecR domain-containing protein [Tunicatimonas pelagia]
MNYEEYSVEDFVLNESFREWVLENNQDPQAYWGRWLETHPQKAELVVQAIELVQQLPMLPVKLNETQITSITQSIEEGIDELERVRPQPTGEGKTVPLMEYANNPQKKESPLYQQVRYRPMLMAIAASFILMVGLVYVAYDYLANKELPSVVYESIVKETKNGQKLTVFLADGSKVILNSGSKISYTKPFQPNQRAVILEGEAFFEVVKDSLRPFQVISGELTTTVLGTSFNVMAYPTDSLFSVSLATGKVRMGYESIGESLNPEVYHLAPGEQVHYDRNQRNASKELFDTDKVLAWKAGVIYLENANQATVLKILERWYGIPIKVDGGDPKAWNVNAKFDNQSLKSVLTSLSYINGFSFQINEDHVLIKY